MVQQSGFLLVGTKGALIVLLKMQDPQYMIHMAMGIDLSGNRQFMFPDVVIKNLFFFGGIKSRIHHQAMA
jgi:hypothetical protein